MLLVPIDVKNSNIDEYGVFAKKGIKAGTVIWKYHISTCRQMTKESFLRKCRFSDFHEILAMIKESNIKDEIVWQFIDNARLIGHSKTPNVAFDKLDQIVALRPIKRGEALTMDFKEAYDKDNFFNKKFPTTNNRRQFLQYLYEHLGEHYEYGPPQKLFPTGNHVSLELVS